MTISLDKSNIVLLKSLLRPIYLQSTFFKNIEFRTCWSGKWTNDGPGTIGNQKGRHIVSLWPDLDYCFNTLDIIRGILNLLGLQTKSSLNPTNRVNTYGRQIIHSSNVFFSNITY